MYLFFKKKINFFFFSNIKIKQINIIDEFKTSVPANKDIGSIESKMRFKFCKFGL